MMDSGSSLLKSPHATYYHFLYKKRQLTKSSLRFSAKMGRAQAECSREEIIPVSYIAFSRLQGLAVYVLRRRLYRRLCS